MACWPIAATRDVHAIVVTRNRVALLGRCLDAIAAAGVDPSAIVVVDNGSSDGTDEWLAAEWPAVDVIATGENLGPAGGFDRGMERAMARGAEWLWLFNDDDAPLAGALTALLQAADAEPALGVVAPWSVDDEGRPVVEGSRWSRGRKHPPPPVPPGSVAPLDIVPASAALVRRAVVDDVGRFDPTLFMMVEEDDFCLRARGAGWRVGALTAPLVRSVRAGSAPGAGSAWRGYYQTRNHLLMARSHRSWIEVAAWAVRTMKFLGAAVLLLDDKRARVRYRLLGAWHGIRGVRGRTINPP